MSLRVLQIAADAAWREAPLQGWRKFGVPEGGPFDRESWARCCALANSSRAIEIGPFGGSFIAEADITVAVTGASRALSNGRHMLRAGERLDLGTLRRGARTYLAPFGSPPRMAQGLEVQFVSRGDVLQGLPAAAMRLGLPPNSLREGAIRVVAGPQASLFDLDAFAAGDWSVGLAADRTGIRLDGPQLAPSQAWGDRPSEPQVTGTIQITSGGTPIVIGPDGPTIGGYPKVAVVIDADRDVLGQVKPGDRLSFSLIGLDEARAFRRDYHARLRALHAVSL